MDPSSLTWHLFCQATIRFCFAIAQTRATYVLATSYRTWMTIVIGLLLLLWVVGGTVLWQSPSLSLLPGLAHLVFGLVMANYYLEKRRDSNKTKNSRTDFFWPFVFPAAAATISFFLGVLAWFNKPVDHQFAILYMLTVFILVPAMIHEHTAGLSRVPNLHIVVAFQSPLDLTCQRFGQEDPEKRSG
ncbi:uncharacterized protein LMH87_007614 [Akanthomyces muscarius]|uniref:Uncharacterized protein n=1 Tax=Akanthomyces muscarius TaxID=2231603 RepID=A0A9W8QMW6_AKAMU|nr:uncharacterized protein LMH87_007614 [Akanthomyces muscarius]KAJ4161583.1 hypothetical protein LMH87_007614 [Akanthomyces muscarius]